MNRIPVQLVIVTTMPSTIDVFLREQIADARTAGADVSIACADDDGLGKLRDSVIARHAVPFPRVMRPWSLLKAALELLRWLHQIRPEIVHTHTPIAAVIGQAAACFAHVPCRVTTVHGLYFVNVSNPVSRQLFKSLEVLACRLATKVICVSEEDARYLVEQHGFAEKKIACFHVGVNLEVYSPEVAGAGERRAVREEFGIPQDAVVFGIVARMVKEKGFVELFQAFSEVSKRYPNAVLLHVGPVDNSRDDGITPEEAKRCGCFERCRFTGMRTDVPRFLAAMDVMVLPTHREGYPVSVMEAAAMGLPCITTDIRGCREAVVDGATGIIVPPRDPAALAAAMEKLLAEPELRAQMGHNALQRAREHFDRRIVVERTLEIYRQELERVGIRSPDCPNRSAG